MEILEVAIICLFIWLLHLSSELDKDFKRLNERIDSVSDRIYELEGGDDQMEYESKLINRFYGAGDEEQKS